jgi:4-amino-4-deoxy-L-arabinose transferase-like glycosyltransferase
VSVAAGEAVPARIGRLVAVALALSVGVRLASLALYPLSDTTEARYAEIARRMLAQGDWITPWFADGVPFWGKPPLYAWVTAGSMGLFGVNEWAARLPHFLAGVLVAWWIADWARERGDREALIAAALAWGAVLWHLMAGAVAVDMPLLMGTTLAMRGFWLGVHAPGARGRREGWLLFVGLAIGLLAKGPVALVLAGVPIVAWTLATRQAGTVWRALPWARGTALTLALAAPWYVAAELRTPGFLAYFLVGEHWSRFTVPDWAGDRYGTPHVAPRGIVWLLALGACLPWTAIALLLLPVRGRGAPAAPDERRRALYLLLWGLAPCVFFTASRNVLWTYVLPGMPALALLGAAWLARDPRRARVDRAVAAGVLLTCAAMVGTVGVREFLGTHKSARDVVAALRASRGGVDGVLWVGSRQFSAAFYTRGNAPEVPDFAALKERLRRERTGRAARATTRFVAVPTWHGDPMPEEVAVLLDPQGRYGAYRLYAVRR